MTAPGWQRHRDPSPDAGLTTWQAISALIWLIIISAWGFMITVGVLHGWIDAVPTVSWRAALALAAAFWIVVVFLTSFIAAIRD